MKKPALILSILMLILLLAGCPFLRKPLKIDDQIANQGDLVQIDLRDFTDSRDIDTVVFEKLSGVGKIEGTIYKWIADFYEHGGRHGLFLVEILARNSRGVEVEDSFTVTVNRRPSLPSNPNPSDGTENTETYVLLSWSSHDPDVDDEEIDDFLVFDVYVGEGSAEELSKIASGISESSIAINEMNHSSTYFWRIVSRDRNSTVHGPVWSFTTNPVEHEVTLSSSPTDGGELSGQGFYAHGSQAVVTAEPGYSYEFNGWYEDGEIVFGDAIYAFEVNRDRSLVAEFVPTKLHTLTLEASPAEGGVVAGEGVYMHGQLVTISATPADVWAFVKWVVGDKEHFKTVVSVVIENDSLGIAFFKGPELSFYSTPKNGLPLVINEELLFTPANVPIAPGEIIIVDVFEELSMDLNDRISGNDAFFSFIEWEDGSIELTRSFYDQESVSYALLYSAQYKVETTSWPSRVFELDGAGIYSSGESVTFSAPKTLTLEDGTVLEFYSWEVNGKSIRTAPVEGFLYLELEIDEPKEVTVVYSGCKAG